MKILSILLLTNALNINSKSVSNPQSTKAFVIKVAKVIALSIMIGGLVTRSNVFIGIIHEIIFARNIIKANAFIHLFDIVVLLLNSILFAKYGKNLIKDIMND